MADATLYTRMELRVRDAEKQLQRYVNSVDRNMSQVERRTAASNKRVQASMAGMFKTFGSGLAGGVAAGLSIDGAQKLIDASTRIQNALKAAGVQGAELDRVYRQLFESAQRTATPIESLVTLYSRLALAQGELGVSQADLLKFTDQIAVALQAGGTSAEQASGALLQLTQALGGGVVRAEEFNSLLEGTPTIVQTAANGLKEAGGSVATLRNLVNDGKVSSEAFFRAFQAGAVDLQAKVANSELTISGAFVRLQNVLIDTAMRFDDSTGASQALARALSGPVAEAIQGLGDLFIELGKPVGTFIDWMNKAVDAAVQGAADIGAALGTDQLGGSPYIGQGRIQERIDSAFAGTSFTTPKTGRRGGTTVNLNKPAAVAKAVSLADYPISGSGASGAGSTRAIQANTAAVKENKDAWEGLREVETGVTTVTDAVRLQEQAMKDLGDIGVDAMRGLANALSDGKLEANELLTVLLDVAQQLISMKSLGGGAGGGAVGSLLASFFGGSGTNFAALSASGNYLFDNGGFTGSGGKNKPAGIVHAGEFVFSKKAVDRIGAARLEDMHNRLAGFASGGLVGAPVPSGRLAGVPQQAVHVTVGVDPKTGNITAFVLPVVRGEIGRYDRSQAPQTVMRTIEGYNKRASR